MIGVKSREATLGRLEGRVAIVSGAGRGLGRAHSLFLAEHGAAVVVNDLGGDVHGTGKDPTPAQQVVSQIEALGGRAVASGHDVANWTQAEELIQLAIETFGDLHVLVNNAGILRDRTLANMTEEEWDAVVRVHLKGHAAPTRHAMAYWRKQSKAGLEVKASIVNTSSASGLLGKFGQANYGAAKLAIVALSHIAAIEGRNYGIRSNAIAPAARTRMGATIPGSEDESPPAPTSPDPFDPAMVSPLIGWLALAACPATSQIFHIWANRIIVSAMPPLLDDLQTEGRWTLDELDKQLPSRLVNPPDATNLLAEILEADAPPSV